MQSHGSDTIADRAFGWEDQERFALLSGDRNPIHVDSIAARRALPGSAVVHGVHLLLWTLDALATREPGLPPLARLRAQFNRFTYLDDRVNAAVTRRSTDEMRLTITGGGTVRCDIRLAFAESGILRPAPTWAPDNFYPLDIGPIDHSRCDIAGMSGRVAVADTIDVLAATFSAAADWIGASRLATLAAATRLVGMIVPGLHSILTALDLSPCEVVPGRPLAFEMKALRHGLIDADIHGGGFVGSLTSLCPKPPVVQPGIAALRDMVAPDTFAGTTALVVGGSRGVGELTAKLLALGGAKIMLTYCTGKADALAVADDIRSVGGDCTVLHYNAAQPAAPQLQDLAEAPSHAYFFATPMIARPNSRFFDPDRFAEFAEVYIHGFWSLAKELHRKRSGVRLFYPTTELGAKVPSGLGEYAMSKAAGETMADVVNTALAPASVIIGRLPWMTTDQTNRLSLPELALVSATILSAILEMQAGPT